MFELVQPPVPVLRISDMDKALKFYVEYLELEIEFEHQFHETAPKYMGVRNGELLLHLTEHHGDACPGCRFILNVADLDPLVERLNNKGLGASVQIHDDARRGLRAAELPDPFGNRITLHQRLEQSVEPTGAMFDLVEPVTPILRSFDMAKLEEFYFGWLEMKEDWRHQFKQGGATYMQVSDGDVRLHLSEHHGDCTPGSNYTFYVKDLEAMLQRLNDKNYRFNRPGVGNNIPGLKDSHLLDPAGNKLTLLERIAT